MKRLVLAACMAATFAAIVPWQDAKAETPRGERFDGRTLDAERARLQNQLRAAAKAFDAALPADAAARDEWHDYLKWNEWAAPLLATSEWNVPTIERVAWRLYAAKSGFENPLILNFRQAMVDYAMFDEAVRAAKGDLPGEFRRRLDRLDRALAADALDYDELEDAAWWLAVLRQAPQALAQARSRFAAPVIVVQVHRDLVEKKLAQFQRTSQEQRTTRNRIQGANVVGAADVRSRTTAQMFEAPGDVRLRVVTHGEVAAPRNVSTSGRVRVTSSSQSQFTVTSEVYWNAGRFAFTAPQASADMRSTVRSIEAPRLIRRAAERRVQESRRAAVAQGESIIEREAVQSMTDRLAAAVDKFNDRSAGFLNFLTQTGNKAQRWSTGLSLSAVEIGFTPSTHAGIGAAPEAMPPLKGVETLGLSFHDGGIEGILRAQVAGKVWTDVNFSMLQRELTGGNSEEMMIGLEPGRWSAQWEWRHPVRIHFLRDCATVRYRFARVEIDGSVYDAPFEVEARMQASAPPLGFEMRLLAPATVTSLNPARPLPPHFQAFLEHKFRGLFGERFTLDGMQFPVGGALDPMAVFRVASIRLDANWAHLRYTNRKPQAELVSTQTASEAAP